MRSGRGAVLEASYKLVRAARSMPGEHPTVDFALATLTRALDLPAKSPLTLFFLGRAIR